MYSRTPALFFLSLCAVPGVVRAESGPYFPGATLTLLVLYNGIFEADAAPHKFRRTLSNFFRRSIRKNSNTEDNSTTERPDEKDVITRDVKQHLRTILTTYVLQAWVNGSNAGLEKELQPLTVARNSKGQAGIRKALRWRSPPSPGSSGLDTICKEGESIRFVSTIDEGPLRVTRTPRMDNSLKYMNIQHPDFGAMTLRTVMLSVSEALNPMKVIPFLCLLQSSINLPAPLGKRSPIDIQKGFGLLMALDIYRMRGKYMPSDPDVPGKVIYNMFFLHSPIECGMLDLIQVVNEQVKESRAGTAYQARLSMTVQTLSILSKLRKAHLVPPRLDAGSFVVTPTGDVLLAKFSPLLTEKESYVIYPDGVIGKNKQEGQKKNGFSRLSDGGKGALPYELDTSQADEDTANLLVQIWCPPALGGVGGAKAAAAAAAKSFPYTISSNSARRPDPFRTSSSSEEDTSSPEADSVRASNSAPSAMSTSSDDEGAAGYVDIDWTLCPGVPHEVQRMFDGLTRGYITLADITLLHDFQELSRSAKDPPSPPPTK